MIINLKPGEDEKTLNKLVSRLEEDGITNDRLSIIRGENSIVVGIIGDTSKLDPRRYQAILGVDNAVRISDPAKELTKLFHPENTVIELSNGHKVGKELTMIAGPCAVENREQLLKAARMVKEAGANVLRGGAYKPRTGPGSFEGLREEGLEYLALAREETGLPIATELMDTSLMPLFEKYDVDIYQIGARNCQNFYLLDALREVKKPAILKRGSSVPLEEFMLAALRIYNGNKQVILCERGDRSVDKVHRNVLNLNNIPIIKQKYHLPVIVDPSHGTGRRESILPMSYAGIAAGADGILVEVHPNPEEALCDGPQSINGEIKRLIEVSRTLYETTRNGCFGNGCCGRHKS